jgi:sugar/nucleoside kinase (ribokinase family)
MNDIKRIQHHVLGIVGNLARDFKLPNASIGQAEDGRIVVNHAGRKYPVSVEGNISLGAKVSTYGLPTDLLATATMVSYGGGAFNSLIALRMISPTLPIRYLDSCFFSADFEKHIASQAVQFDCLKLRPIPNNVVVGRRCNKVILKSPICPSDAMNELQCGKLDWLTESQAVLANSIKDPPVVELLVQSATRRLTRLYAVLTQSLSSDFVCSRVFPAASVIFSNWDQVSHLTGLKFEQTLEGALLALDWLRSRAPDAHNFLTMAKQGTLVAPAGEFVGYHVRLKSPLQTNKPDERACGCGDAFAAGVFAYLEDGSTLLTSFSSRCRQQLSGALSGCAAAVRWLGSAQQLSEGDFAIQEFPLGKRVVP